MLPKNGTIYIVAPHEVFVSKLIPMTFFLLLLAFTDGTSRRAEVLPRSAVARHTIAEYLYALDTTAEIVYALDTTEVESYVYDSSLPVFQRCGNRSCFLRDCGGVEGVNLRVTLRWVASMCNVFDGYDCSPVFLPSQCILRIAASSFDLLWCAACISSGGGLHEG